MNQALPPLEPSAPPPFSFRSLVKTGGIIPAVVATVIGCAVIGVISTIVWRTVHNHQFLPIPKALAPYTCQGFAAPFSIAFRNGVNVVQLRANGQTLDGTVLNGRIEWAQTPGKPGPLAFALPTHIVYVDTHSIHVLDAQQVEQRCVQTP